MQCAPRLPDMLALRDRDLANAEVEENCKFDLARSGLTA